LATTGIVFGEADPPTTFKRLKRWLQPLLADHLSPITGVPGHIFLRCRPRMRSRARPWC